MRNCCHYTEKCKKGQPFSSAVNDCICMYSLLQQLINAFTTSTIVVPSKPNHIIFCMSFIANICKNMLLLIIPSYLQKSFCISQNWAKTQSFKHSHLCNKTLTYHLTPYHPYPTYIESTW